MKQFKLIRGTPLAVSECRILRSTVSHCKNGAQSQVHLTLRLAYRKRDRTRTVVADQPDPEEPVAPIIDARTTLTTPTARDAKKLLWRCGASVFRAIKPLVTPAVKLFGHIIGATIGFAVLFMLSVGVAKGLDWADEKFDVPQFIRFVFTWLERGGFLLDCSLYVFYLVVAARAFMREMLQLFSKEGG